MKGRMGDNTFYFSPSPLLPFSHWEGLIFRSAEIAGAHRASPEGSRFLAAERAAGVGSNPRESRDGHNRVFG